MADPRAVTRLIDELLWSIRRAGVSLSPAQAIDAARAALLVGFDDQERFRDAVGAVVVTRAREREPFERAFEEFFASKKPGRTLSERLLAEGFTALEIAALEELLSDMNGASGAAMAPLGALLSGGADVDCLLSLAGLGDEARTTAALQRGFATYRLLERAGLSAARRGLAQLGGLLSDAIGSERAALLMTVLTRELDLAAGKMLDTVRRAFSDHVVEKASVKLEERAFTVLHDREIAEMKRALRNFAVRLRGGARVRARRAKKGRFDPRRTMRRALATGGVPFKPARKLRRRERPRLILICDVSDSVRSVATFMLEFVYAAHELFERTRSFVFVSELGETTDLFARERPTVALGQALGGGVVSVAENSNYGRMLRAFEQKYLDAVDRQTTVVVLGDGRTNYMDDGAEVLDRIRARAKALLWLSPETKGEWAAGDSAMSRYAPKCTEVYEVRSVRDLERATRAVAMRR